MAETKMTALYIRVSGRVQGVGFRFSTARQAKELSLSGYVRNLPEGSVEVVAEGETTRVQSLLKWLKQGPTGSFVQDIETRPLTYTGTYRGFSIEY